MIETPKKHPPGPYTGPTDMTEEELMRVYGTSPKTVHSWIPVRPAPQDDPTWLDQAKAVTEQSRQVEYGNPLINFLRIAVQWTMFLQEKLRPGKFIDPVDVAWMMIGTKVARETHTHKDDNPVDTMGYAACHDRINRYMVVRGYNDGGEAFDSMTFGEMCSLMEKIAQEISSERSEA